MNLYLQDVKELSVGEMYEMSVGDMRAWVGWFETHDLVRCANRPANGTIVVYLGKGKEHHTFYHSMLSSEGKMYRVYNTDFIYGLKRIKEKVATE